MLIIACDGSLRGNRGGWAFVRSDGSVAAGTLSTGSSSRCELMAVLQALRSVSEGVEAVILTDHDADGRKFAAYRHYDALPERTPDADLWEEIQRIARPGITVRRPESAEEWALHARAHHACRACSWASRVGSDAGGPAR